LQHNCTQKASGCSGLFIDADVVVGGGEDVKSINEAVGAGADDDDELDK